MGFWGPAQKQEQKPKLRDSDPERKWGCTEELVTGSLLLDVPGSALHLPPTMGLGSNSPTSAARTPVWRQGGSPWPPVLCRESPGAGLSGGKPATGLWV